MSLFAFVVTAKHVSVPQPAGTCVAFLTCFGFILWFFKAFVILITSKLHFLHFKNLKVQMEGTVSMHANKGKPGDRSVV